MKNEEKAFTILILVIMLLMVFMSFKYSSGSKMLPLLSGIFSAALMAFLVVISFSSRVLSWYQKLEKEAVLAMENVEKEERKREIYIVGWFAGCTAAIYILGFMMGIPLFLFLFLKIWGKESWVLSLVCAGVVLGVIYFSFVDILNVPLHKGIFLK